MLINQCRVLLIGGSGGIGQSMTEALRGLGAHVIPVGRRWKNGTPTDSVTADITLANDRARLLEVMHRESVNVVVMAAGMSSFKPVEHTQEDEVKNVLGVNLIAPIQLTSEMLPQLLSQPQAQVIFVGSVLGHMGLPGYALYGSSKWGLRGFAQALRREVAGSNLRVKYLSPRATRTEFNSPSALVYNELTHTKSDDVAVVASSLVRLLQSNACEQVVGWPESLAVRLNAVWPALMDLILRQHARILKSLFTSFSKSEA
jgi:short-subunit dehydrogenase